MNLGSIYALLAYFAWGISPIFWRELKHIPPTYLLAHRVIWAGLLFGALLLWRGRVREMVSALRSRSSLLLLLSAALLAINWFIYLYAVATDRVLDASLGYFINPLVNVVFGLVFLGEKLRRAQWIAVFLAASGVAVLAIKTVGTPWISLTLAGTFGSYGLLRKTIRHDALLGGNLEMLFMLPLALPILAIPDAVHATPPQLNLTDRVLLLGTGVQTALPLLWFSNAARRLPLTTLGFFQYIAPTLQFLLAIFLFREPFGATQLASFLLIWLALVVMTVEAQSHRLRFARSNRVSTR